VARKEEQPVFERGDMRGERAWTAARAEHDAALAACLAELERIPSDRWTEPRAEGKWCPAEEALHVALAYEVAVASIEGGPGMELRVTPVRASLLRWIFLPRLLHTGNFPRAVPAPREIRPSHAYAVTLSPPDVAARLRNSAEAAVNALRTAFVQRPPIKVSHAYFGPLRPLKALRLLSVHTRHHAAHLAQQSAATTAAKSASTAPAGVELPA
jgi:hypothetical protein